MKKILTGIAAIIATFSLTIPTLALTATYESMNVPSINSSFKTWMDYRLIADNTPQSNWINRWGWMDYEGFMRCDGERDLGIDQDYYLIALGSYYSTSIGDKFRFTTDTGNVFYGAMVEFKDDNDTNSTHQYCPGNQDIVEFMIHTPSLNSNVKIMGSANVYMPLNGSITKIEKINFID